MRRARDVEPGGLLCDMCGKQSVTVYHTPLQTAHVCFPCKRYAIAYGTRDEDGAPNLETLTGFISRQPKLHPNEPACRAIANALAGGPPDATITRNAALVARYEKCRRSPWEERR